MTTLGFSAFVDRVRSITSFDIPEGVQPTVSLVDELAIDSIQVYELMVISEGLAGCLFPPPDLPTLLTLGDVYEYYTACRDEQ